MSVWNPEKRSLHPIAFARTCQCKRSSLTRNGAYFHLCCPTATTITTTSAAATVRTPDSTSKVWSWVPDYNQGDQWETGYRSSSSGTPTSTPSNSYEAVRQSVLYERVIETITGNTITLVQPLVQKIASKFGSAWVFPASVGGAHKAQLPMVRCLLPKIRRFWHAHVPFRRVVSLPVRVLPDTFFFYRTVLEMVEMVFSSTK